MTDKKTQIKALRGLVEIRIMLEKQLEIMQDLFPDRQTVKVLNNGDIILFHSGALWLSLVTTTTHIDQLINSIKHPENDPRAAVRMSTYLPKKPTIN